MVKTRGSYPHPVLDESNDVDSHIELNNASYSTSIEDVQLRFEVTTADPTLWRLVESGAVRASARWMCSATMSSEEVEPITRRKFSDRAAYEMFIDQQLVRGTVDVVVRYIANTDIKEFRWDKQHTDYGDATFSVSKGDIIAVAGEMGPISVEKLYDPFNPPTGSLFNFVEDTLPNAAKGIAVEFHNADAVTVKFRPDAFDGLREFQSRPDLQVAIVVMPALMATIEYLKNQKLSPEGDDLSEFLWAQSLEALISRSGTTIEDDTIVIAQRLLDGPIQRTLTTGLIEEEND